MKNRPYNIFKTTIFFSELSEKHNRLYRDRDSGNVECIMIEESYLHNKRITYIL